jgi:hypothetical protein
MPTYTAHLSEAVVAESVLRDWQNEPGNDGFGNPPVDFLWHNWNEVTLSTTGWDEISLKRTFSIAVHRTAPKCKIAWS